MKVVSCFFLYPGRLTVVWLWLIIAEERSYVNTGVKWEKVDIAGGFCGVDCVGHGFIAGDWVFVEKRGQSEWGAGGGGKIGSRKTSTWGESENGGRRDGGWTNDSRYTWDGKGGGSGGDFAWGKRRRGHSSCWCGGGSWRIAELAEMDEVIFSRFVSIYFSWCQRVDSNHRPHTYEICALTAELRWHFKAILAWKIPSKVGMRWFSIDGYFWLRGQELRLVWKIMSLPCDCTLPRALFATNWGYSIRKCFTWQPHSASFILLH